MTTHAGPLGPSAPVGRKPAVAPVKPAAVDRTARRAARRTFRPRRVWPALIVAGLLTAAGALVAIEVIATLVDQPARLFAYDRAVSWATSTQWNDVVTIVIASVLLALGVWCVLAGLSPGRNSLVQLRSDDPDLVLGVTPRGLRSAVAAAAKDVEMVSGVRDVKLRKRRVVVSVDTPLRAPEDLNERVRNAVQARLDELGPQPRRGVVVRTRSKEG